MNISDNGTFMSTKDLLGCLPPEQAMSNVIINKTLQESAEVRQAAAAASGKGTNIDIRA